MLLCVCCETISLPSSSNFTICRITTIPSRRNIFIPRTPHSYRSPSALIYPPTTHNIPYTHTQLASNINHDRHQTPSSCHRQCWHIILPHLQLDPAHDPQWKSKYTLDFLIRSGFTPSRTIHPTPVSSNTSFPYFFHPPFIEKQHHPRTTPTPVRKRPDPMSVRSDAPGMDSRG